MKKLLITLLLLSPFAYADMDRVCTVVITYGGMDEIRNQLQEKKCDRDNVLEVYAAKYDESTRGSFLLISNTFCRFDRNRDIERNVLSCILYSTKARRSPLKN